MTSGSKIADLRILLVEDQAESRSLLRGILSELGITQVFEAADGRVGLQFI
ncbi:MAG: two-component system response regulator, partial [Micavibrio aeruginosavorus]